MPQIVVAVAAAAAASWAGPAAAVALGLTTATGALTATGVLVSALVGGVVAMAVGYGLSAVLGLNRVPKAGTANAQDRKQLIRSPVTPHRIVYGRARVSGPIVYASSSGAKKEFLHLVVPLAGHPIFNIDAVWLNDERIPIQDLAVDGMVQTGTYAGKIRIRRYLGDQTTADGALVAESPDGWGPDHIGYGIPYIYARLEYDPDVFSGGIPNISAEVRGKRVYDPRTGVTDYSNNPALCIRDYMVGDHGFNVGPDQIDEGYWIAAANICDELVQLNAEATEWQKRYELDGVWDTDRAKMDIVEELLSSCAGTMVFVQGRYRLHAGAYDAPVGTLDASDLAGPIEVVTKPPRRELFNTVQGTFISPNHYWQAHEFPAYSEPGFVVEDGEEIVREAELPATIDPTRAQRLAKLLLRRARESLTVQVPVKYRALRFCVWDTLSLTFPELGWANKVFRIQSFSFSIETGIITLTLREEGAGSYGWLYDDAAAIPPSQDTDLISPLAIPAPTNLVVTPITALNGDGSVVPALAVTWTGAAHAFVTAHEVQWRNTTVGPWNSAEVTSGTDRFVIRPVFVGDVLDVRVRAIAGLVRGPWTGIASGAGAPDTTPPGPVQTPTVVGGIKLISLRWGNPSDSDFDGVEVWENTVNDSGSAYILSLSKTNFFVRENAPPGQTFHYWLRTKDRSGNVGPLVYAGSATARNTETADIENNAVTASSAGVWSGTHTSGGWTTLLTVVAGDGVTAGDMSVQCFARGYAGISNDSGGGTMPGSFFIRLLRNGVEVENGRFGTINEEGTISLLFTEPVSPGWYTYQIQGGVGSGINDHIARVRMSAILLKR